MKTRESVFEQFDAESKPAVWKEHEEIEVLLNEYVTSFEDQFVQLFPHRNRLLLLPEIESNLTKFISTLIRPSNLPYDFFHYTDCSQFVSDYIQHEPLKEPTMLPTSVLTPQTLLNEQVGNSIDMSILLCSLLIGFGYDAYVVIGYAVERITQGDRRLERCPFLEEEEKKAVEKKRVLSANNPYQLPNKSTLTSQYEEVMFERIRAKKDVHDEIHPTFNDEDDEYFGRRYHSWVLVKAGSRDVGTPFFLEPVTGRRIELDTHDFLGVECVFNHLNYYINMQECSEGLKSMDYEFYTPNKWEFIFLTPPVNVGATNSTPLELSATIGAAGSDILEVPPMLFPKLKVPHDQFEKRFPDGSKKFNFFMVDCEIFAEYIRDDGLVKKITFYEDIEKSNIKIVEHYFKNRNDRLERRSIVDKTSYTHEYFGIGRSFSIKELIQTPFRTVFLFYLEGRNDGLIKRVETKDRKYQEFFDKRIDGLTYRSVSFVTKEMQESFKKNIDITNNFHNASDSFNVGDFIIEKMTEKYTKGATKENVFIKRYDVLKSVIKIVHHREEKQLKEETILYNKDDLVQNGVSLDLFEGNENIGNLPIEQVKFRDLIMNERQCLQKVRYSKSEANELLTELQTFELRLYQSGGSYLTRTLYDKKNITNTLSNVISEVTTIDEDTIDASDFLAPYLPDEYELGTVLSHEEAKQTKHACLQALAQRLYERSSIIEERIEREQAELEKRRLQWAKKSEHMVIDREEEADFFKWQDELHSRICIAKDRLNKIEKECAMLYAKLHVKLRNDPRMANLYNQE
ncbi:hypothetical protein PCE1_001491 [Barthelona sp. PCE]